MATVQTLALAAPEWSQGGAEPEEALLDPYFGPLFRVGIYGWRKRCLYFLVVLLFSLVVINLSLTVWIIRVLDFTMDGMGNLRIRKEGVRLEGQSVFQEALYAAEIRSRQEQTLKFESSRNITLHTRNTKGKVTNRLNLGHGRVEAVTKQLTVKGLRGEILLHVDDHEVVMAADKMRVTGQGGITFDGSIQTSIIKSEPTKQLRLESPTRMTRISAPEGVSIESRTGDISATCMKNLKLQSREGSIWLNSEKVEFRNLRTVLPTNRGRSYQGIYEMCSCENGRLFLSNPEGHCQADEKVCQ